MAITNTPKKYFCISVPFKNEIEEEDLIAKFLNFSPLGFKSFEKTLWIYFPYEEDIKEKVFNLLKQEGIKFSFEIFFHQNWNENWKKFFKITKICEGLYVLPPWKKTKRPGLKIYINPALAFGTGTHESTQIAMKLIYKYLLPNQTFLDVGTGSGILSILAKKIGAQVVACDIDESIKENFYENLILNGLKKEDINLFIGSAKDIEEKFDFVVCNIELQHQLPILKYLVKRTKKYLILSGLLKGELTKVFNEIEKYGEFKVLEKISKNNWEGCILEIKK